MLFCHSGNDNVEALAAQEWLRVQGRDDVFFGLDTERDLRADRRWQDPMSPVWAKWK